MKVERATGWLLVCTLALLWSASAAWAGRPQYTLTTEVVGGGYVDPSRGTYLKNNYIQITAVPDWGWLFDHWEGDLNGGDNPTFYRFDSTDYAVHLIAVFAPDPDPPPPPPPPPSPPPEEPVDPRIIGYFPEWGVYQRPYYVKHVVTAGAAGKLTVLNYAFGVPGPDAATGEIACRIDDPFAAYQQTYAAADSLDGLADEPFQALRGHFNQLRKLKALYPDLKIVVSLGGWLGSTYFSDAARTASSREAFVGSCIDLYVNGNLPEANGAGGQGAAAGVFDGIDLDWEYPISGGASGTHHSKDDGANFTLLLDEFRQQFEMIGRPELLLTIAAPGSEYRAQNYNIGDDHPYLDYVQLMTYDFHGDWENRTGHLTNLCTSIDDPASETWRLSVDKAVKLFRDQYGVPSAKIVPGATFYGRGWKRVKSTNDGLYQRGSGAAPGTYEDGYEYYRDLVPLLGQGYAEHWDDLAKAAWLYNPATKIFWSYDEPQSLALKAQYVRFFNLGGLMFWELSGDDDPGTLITTLYDGLKTTSPTEDPCSAP
jgi:chitinase